MAEETTVEPVSETPTGPAAFAAARASASSASSTEDQPETPAEKPDDTSEPETVEDPEKVADQPEETTETEDDGLLTAEQLAALPAKQRVQAEKWQAKLTQKAQAIAAQSKQFEQWKPLIDALTADTDAAIRRLAEERGLKLAEPVAEDPIPEELKVLEPIFTEREKRLEAKIRAELAPLKEGLDRITSEAVAAETESTIAKFEAKYPDWRKHESRMLELGSKFVPAPGAMTDYQYMQHLYTLVTAEISEAEKTKQVIAKINKAAEKADTVESGVKNSRVEHALPPPDKRSIRDAFEAAKRGERWVD